MEINFLISNIFAIIFICSSFFSTSFAFSLAVDENAFLAFVKGPAAFEQFCADKEIRNAQSKEMLAQIYGTHLGLLHHMRKQWQSANANAKIQNENERSFFLKTLNVLYEYLFREHIGHSTAVKPSYGYSTAGCCGTGCYTVFDDIKGLARVSKIYFNWSFGEDNDEWLDEMYTSLDCFEHLPVILNETALDCHHREQNDLSEARANFRKIMEKMYNKAKENVAKMEQNKIDEKIFLSGNEQLFGMEIGQIPSLSSSLTLASSASSSSSESAPKSADANKNYDEKKDEIILNLLVYEVENVIEDEAFLLFVKGQPNFMYVLQYASETVTRHNRRQTVDETNKRFYTQKYEKHLGILYLIRRDWHCAENVTKSKQESSGNKNAQEAESNDPAVVQYDKSAECKKFRSYLDMVYEFLFRVHNGVASSVKPIFEMSGTILTLIDVISALGKISNLNFGFVFENFVDADPQKLKLLNWVELLKYKKTAAKPKFQTEELFIQVASEKQDHQKLTDGVYEGLVRHAFDEYLEAMWMKLASEKGEDDG